MQTFYKILEFLISLRLDLYMVGKIFLKYLIPSSPILRHQILNIRQYSVLLQSHLANAVLKHQNIPY
jgi:hypothetical protein